MFKKTREVFGAAWAVLQNNDIDKPVKKRKPNKKEIDKHLAMLEKQKALATERQEPWVAIVTMDVDYNNLANGSFELDWNDHFLTQLMRYGYQGKVDADIVDQWFTDVCRNVVLETFEQEDADAHPVQSTDLGAGKREYR